MLTVVYDACVFYPATVRDLLLTLSLAKLFQAKWTNEIHDEWIRNLIIDRPDLIEKLQRIKYLINSSIDDCLIYDYEEIIPQINLPDQNDRHVLAAAIKANAEAIITYNLKDFPSKELDKFNIKAIHPDDFIYGLIVNFPNEFLQSIQIILNRLKNPPLTLKEYANSLSAHSLIKVSKYLKDLSEKTKDY